MDKLETAERAYTKALGDFDKHLAHIEDQVTDLHRLAQAAGRWCAPLGHLAPAVAAARAAIRQTEPGAVGVVTEDAKARQLQDAKAAVDQAARRLAWAKRLPGETGAQSVSYWQHGLWRARAEVQFLESGTWPEPLDYIAPDPLELAANRNISVDAACEMLGMAPRKREPLPPMPR